MPKIQPFEFVVSGTPEEVAARLQAQTRFRLLPFQATIGGGGPRPFGGRVGKRGFRIALDPRSWFQLYQAVAVGTLESAGTNLTRVKGTAGLPTGVTWAARASFGAPLLMTGILAASSTGLDPVQVLGAGAVATVAMTILGIGVMGTHVANADAQVPGLVDTLQATLEGPSSALAGQTSSAASGEASSSRQSVPRPVTRDSNR